MVSPTTEDTESSARQARAQLDTLIEMVDRLNHLQECDGDEDCELDRDTILGGVNIWSGNDVSPEEFETFKEQYHDDEDAGRAIDEDPLSLQVRSEWHSPGDSGEDDEFEILLCTGGPAVRIVGEFGYMHQPEKARIQHQDWFKPWEDLSTTRAEEEAMVTFASHFYWGD
jgi:hypothetical protein